MKNTLIIFAGIALMTHAICVGMQEGHYKIMRPGTQTATTSAQMATTAQAAQGQQMPEGSYKETCTSCEYNQATQTLDCICRYGKKNEKKRPAKKSGCTSYKNVDGSLMCE